MNQGGRDLGILQNNQLVFDTEDQVAVLLDYCIHDIRQQTGNAIDRYLAVSPPPPGSDELVLIRALQQARYSIFTIESIEPGVGINVRDLLSDETHFLFDLGLSRSAKIGLVLAARVIAPEGIGMTTGTGLPIGVLTTEERSKLLKNVQTALPGQDLRNISLEQASRLTAMLIQSCLKRGAAKHIRYADVETGKVSGSSQSTRSLPPKQHLGRNSPCPCGSGRKFKVCCGRPR
ncbi:hypothetical protein BH10PLA2_BH10PLA2_03660 [soil metagenome]